MTYITKLTGRKATSISQIVTMVLAGFVLVIVQSSTVHAQWTNSGSNIYNSNTGNVGIGITAPTELVHVRKNQNAATHVLVENATAGASAYADLQVKNNLGHFAQFGLYSSTTTTAGALASGNAFAYTTSPALVIMANNASGIIKFATGGLSERMRIDASGNVGIGTTSPSAGLDVQNPITAVTAYGVRVQQALTAGSNNAELNGLYINTTFVDGVNVGVRHNALVTGAGNVGLGTSVTSAGLDVQNVGIAASGSTFGTRVQQVLPSAGNNAVSTAVFINPTFSDGQAVGVTHNGLVVASGNIGIGTSATSAGLDVQNIGIAALGNTYGTRVQQVLPSAGNYGVSTAVYINPTFSDGQAIGVRHNGLVVASGDVGIGTSTPSTKLHVVGDSTITGNLTVTGNIAAKYQDVAEWVQSSQELPAGTVVVLDPTKSNQVIASTQSYDTRAAGVVSANPGITLGENGAGKVLVATTGRVRIKVDASRGSIRSIQVGDLLVTSDVPGVAMKSQPINVGGVQIHRPGTLIGKALEPLAKGTGEILVLLSLQ